MLVTKQRFGTLCDGTKVRLYTIRNEKMAVCVTDYGCTITSILLPGKNGTMDDILLGYSTLDGYINSPGYSFGSIVGRFANRIGNASFTLNGKKYQLDKNDNEINTLHGGFLRYDHMVWNSEVVYVKDGAGVKFTRTSPDGEQGFPGNMNISVTYTLSEDNRLTLRYEAECDQPTPVNFTNHAYFNLAGKGSILNHELQMDCDGYLEVDANLIPTGKIIPVDGTEFDFKTKKAIGCDISKTENGYDHCYVSKAYGTEGCGCPSDPRKTVKVASLTDPESGRTMTVESNQEGIQLYTGNWIGGLTGKNGQIYKRHDAVCLETQCMPDTPNKPDFPSCILGCGKKYDAITVYGFEF